MITVGDSMPVNFTNDDSSSAAFTRSPTTFAQTSCKAPVGGTYFSMYMRTVAPEPAVPDSRKITLEPSSMRNRMPWFLLIEPSTGSKYSKTSAVAILLPCTTRPVFDDVADVMAANMNRNEKENGLPILYPLAGQQAKKSSRSAGVGGGLSCAVGNCFAQQTNGRRATLTPSPMAKIGHHGLTAEDKENSNIEAALEGIATLKEVLSRKNSAHELDVEVIPRANCLLFPIHSDASTRRLETSASDPTSAFPQPRSRASR